jgi:hypothetical protein
LVLDALAHSVQSLLVVAKLMETLRDFYNACTLHLTALQVELWPTLHPKRLVLGNGGFALSYSRKMELDLIALFKFGGVLSIRLMD